MFEGREREWPARLAGHGYSSSDLVIMHPSHVAGFLQHSGFPHSSVTWVHHPIPILSARRLGPSELEQFKADVRALRISRKLVRHRRID